MGYLLSPELYLCNIWHSHPLLCPSWSNITRVLLEISVSRSDHMDMWPRSSDYIRREKHTAF